MWVGFWRGRASRQTSPPVTTTTRDSDRHACVRARRRALEPENVLVMADGHLKLTDFGTALDERKRRAAENERARARVAAARARIAAAAAGGDGGESGDADDVFYDAADDTADTAEEEAEREDSFVGTAEYLSPEVMAGARATKAADLWSLGVVVFELLTALPGPFSRRSPVATLHAIEVGAQSRARSLASLALSRFALSLAPSCSRSARTWEK